MKTFKIAVLTVALLVTASQISAVDFKVDTTFNPPFTGSQNVHDILVLPDGKLIVAGGTCQHPDGPCSPLLVRLNTDGSLDSTFNSGLSPTALQSRWTGAYRIKPLANGQFLITGYFRIGTAETNIARLNADGSVDGTMVTSFMQTSFTERQVEPLPDGKALVCRERTINGEVYWAAHRINSDGTPDPTFRVTFGDVICRDIKPLPNGKIIMAIGVFDFQDDVVPLVRLNADGSLDTAFEAEVEEGSRATKLAILPDGKILFAWQSGGFNTSSLMRLSPDGALDFDNPLCGDDTFTVFPDGSMYAKGCRRWTGTFGKVLKIAKVLPDGSVDPTVDNLHFSEHSGNSGFRYYDAGNDRLYVKGPFSSIQDNPPAARLARLTPNTAPLKAKWDFDNDGRSDFAVYRPSDGLWYLYQSTAGHAYQQWGFPTDKPAAGHFDNDGKTDIAVFRDGVWHGWSSTSGWRPILLGEAGDKPIVGNFEDRGADMEDFAVRGIRSGIPKWVVREGWTVTYPTSDQYPVTLPNELPSDKPVVGDFDGDGRDNVGFFRDGFWYSADYRGDQSPQTFRWGSAGDIPVPGDYDGDRQTDYAIFRPSTGDWWINRSTEGIIAIRFGLNGDIPVPADYDGDGKVDIAIYRDGAWWQIRSYTGTIRVDTWGIEGDIPIPAQHQ